MYLNGTQISTTGTATISQWNGLDFQSNLLFRLGSVPSWITPFLLFHTGRIAMAQVYFRSLSDAEILQNYNANKEKVWIMSTAAPGKNNTRWISIIFRRQQL
jgi:hypothetical protein